MFDVIAHGHQGTPHTSGTPLLISTALHGAALAAIVAIPMFMASTELPEVPSMMAFVTALPAAAPPPPPPPPAAAPATARQTSAKPSPAAAAVPIDAPAEIRPEAPRPLGFDTGMPGGVEGGVPGGVPGGVVGGMPSDVPPPPPPAPPAPAAMASAPVRVGGEIEAPALLKRVGPEYPDLAVRAQLEGVVILEALVDRQGRVEDVRVLRSIPLLDNAAKAAVRQWQYSPLLLNGKPERFFVTVTVSFSLKRT